MKNKLTKIISSILVLAFLVSALTVFAAADTSAAGDSNTNEELTLLLNREYDEGWNAFNGFKSAVATNKFSIEYEETDKFDYNYFTRVESTEGSGSYLVFDYGTKAPQYGGTVFEFDIKTDDYCNFYESSNGGPIITIKTSESTKNNYQLASISNNVLRITDKGEINSYDTSGNWSNPKPSVDVADLTGDWVHVAYAVSVNQGVCPNCGKIYDLTKDDKPSSIICLCNAVEDDPESGTKVNQLTKRMGIRVYFGYSSTFDAASAVPTPKQYKDIDLTNTYYTDYYGNGLAFIKSISIGIPANHSAKGHSYLLDNVRIYNGTTTPGQKVTGYGSAVDESAAKTEQIISGESTKTVMEYINSGIVMKVGTNNYLNQSKRQPIFESEDGVAYGSPVKVNGEVYVPIQPILDWVGYPMFQHDDGVSFDISTASGSTFITIGRKTATASGETIELSSAPVIYRDEVTGGEYMVVSKDDVEVLFPGNYVTYDDMGLIIISNGDDLISRESDLDLMLDLMKQFVFNTGKADSYIESARINTNDFSHPYLFANQDDFDNIKSKYEMTEGQEGYDANLKGYLTGIVADAAEVYAKYANTDDVIAADGKYLASEIVNPHVPILEEGQTEEDVDSNNGYELKTGRNAELVAYAEELRLLAFAYQVTGEVKYARLAYEFALSLSRWNHWAPAYFIDTADATAAYATAYDWLYNIWVECGFNVETIEDAIYQKGIHMGYSFSSGIELNDKDNSNQGVFAIYNTATDNWNAIGTSGMVIASLAIVGSDYAGASSGDIENMALKGIKYILENNIESLIELGLDAYAPDGSYIQSPEHWSNTTSKLMQMIWALENTVGSDLGLLSTWGMDKTFYYAYQTEYKIGSTDKIAGGYTYWNYHEATGGVLNTSIFFYAAEALGDDLIGALRADQLTTKTANIWDVLAYDEKYYSIDVSSADISRDYVFESCEGFVSRSDFSDTALVVGMMGNANDATSGQIDSGNFIYANKGFTWFGDLGSDNPGLYGYNDENHRYNYYRNTGEGANVVIINTASLSGTIPYGQSLNAGGVLTDYYTEDAGMYAVVDNTAVYGGKAQSAKRAMLVTNNRKTVVIQDEINLWEAQACVWVAQTAAETIIISEDGRTAYLNQYINGTPTMIRATILDPGESLKFEKMDTARNFLLSTTNSANFSTRLGGAPEYERTGLQRLVIRQSEQVTFQCAVVLEVVDKLGSSYPVEYEYTDIRRWNEDIVNESFTVTTKNENVLGSPELMHIVTYTNEATGYVDNGRAYSMRLKEFFRAMVRVASAVETFEPTGQIDRVNQVYLAHKDYQKYLEQYNLFREDINGYVTEAQIIATYLCGYN